MSQVLFTDGEVAGRPYVLAVSLYGLGVWLPATDRDREHVVLVHQRLRSLAEVSAVIDLAAVLAYALVPQRYIVGL